MKYIIALAAMLMVTPVHAGMIDDLIGVPSPILDGYNARAHNASWYVDTKGRTASGMRVTYGIAHKTLPFGTHVHLHCPSTGRSVEAIVTDRGPFIKGRTIDVNQNVANALGFKHNGTAHLNMEVLN